VNLISDILKVSERNLHILEAGKQSPRRRRSDDIYATIGSEIKCDQEIFDSYSYEGWKDIHYDLLILCAAVEYADRRWARGARRWARHIHVTIPVLELATWLDANVQQNLRTTLRHLTGDAWQFTFVRSDGGATNKPRQRPLARLQVCRYHRYCRASVKGQPDYRAGKRTRRTLSRTVATAEHLS